MTPARRDSHPGWSPGAVAGAVLLLTFGLLPLANWLPGGEIVPIYSLWLEGWLTGTAIVLGGGLVLAILSRHLPKLWREGLLARPLGALAARPSAADLVIALVAGACYLAIAWWVFDARPLLIDEIVQMMQARLYTAGHLFGRPAAHPEFVSTMHVIDFGGKVYGQFPPGGPAFLALGDLVGAPWLVGPVAGGVAVLAFARVARAAEPRPTVAAAALLLFAFAPFVAFMAGSYMNHVPTAACLLVAVAALAQATRDETSRPGAAALAGFGLGLAATIRPVDAAAFALPAAVWLLARTARRPRHWPALMAAGGGIALPIAVLLLVNWRTNGAPLEFGYTVLWGPAHGLGFHRAPWGETHTPMRGLELINLYLLRAQNYLYELPLPSLLPASAALLLARRLRPLDRYLLAASALLLGAYFAYWHDGFYLGPRFLYPLAPVAALWTARTLPALRDRLGPGLVYRSAAYGGLIALAVSLAMLVPVRAQQYANGMLTMRFDAAQAAATAGAKDALVFVRETWGAQLVARLWALEIPRGQSELLYRWVDACALDRAIGRLEQENIRGPNAYQALAPMLADSSRVISSPFSPDTTEKVLPGSHYGQACVDRINDDRAGTTLLPPLLLDRRSGNTYVRDLHARDSLLLLRWPARPVFLLKPATAAVGESPQFYRVDRDSLWAAWRAQPAP